jgi:hypothetical protein
MGGSMDASSCMSYGSRPARCPFRKSLVSIFAGQREEWEGMLT